MSFCDPTKSRLMTTNLTWIQIEWNPTYDVFFYFQKIVVRGLNPDSMDFSLSRANLLD